MLVIAAVSNAALFTVIAFALLVVLVALNGLPQRVSRDNVQGRLSGLQLLVFYVSLVLVLAAVGAVCYLARNDFNHAVLVSYFIFNFAVAAAAAISIAIEA